jgi:hypothetical protein
MLVFAIVGGILGPIAPKAQAAAANAQSEFRFEFMESDGHRGRAIEGYVYNELPWTITNVRLRLESLDRGGTVTAESSGWVIGAVPAGGRAYFFVPVSSRATAYRATVQSFDKVTRVAPRPETP